MCSIYTRPPHRRNTVQYVKRTSVCIQYKLIYEYIRVHTYRTQQIIIYVRVLHSVHQHPGIGRVRSITHRIPYYNIMRNAHYYCTRPVV